MKIREAIDTIAEIFYPDARTDIGDAQLKLEFLKGANWLADYLKVDQPGVGPLLAECPVCQAKPGHQCTSPTDTSRRVVTWYHTKREEL